MGKRNFKRKGTYAPKKPRLMMVGERLARLANQPSLNEDANCIDAGGANDEFPTWDSNSLPGSKHSNTSSIAPSSSSVASKKTVNSDAAVSYGEDPLANGSYYIHIPETAHRETFRKPGPRHCISSSKSTGTHPNPPSRLPHDRRGGSRRRLNV